MNRLQGHKLEAALLEAGDDSTDQRALDAVRLRKCPYMRQIGSQNTNMRWLTLIMM